MPTFHIERYELCSTTYEVEAVREAEAVAKLLNGKGLATFRSHEYVEVAADRGLSAADHPQLARELRSSGVPVTEIIPSIRSVRRIK